MPHTHCSECSSKVDLHWDFCPRCGTGIKSRDPFSDVFEGMGKEIAEMNKMLERQIEAMDITPMFGSKKSKPFGQGGGFTISIISSGDRQPEISIKTFGDVDERRLKKQVSQMVGGETELSDVAQSEERDRKARVEPKIKYEATEEPKTKILKAGKGVVVEMDLPGVKNHKDIEIKDMESSVEVKAVSGKKAFFKIIKKPENNSVVAKKFDKEKLTLEFA